MRPHKNYRMMKKRAVEATPQESQQKGRGPEAVDQQEAVEVDVATEYPEYTSSVVEIGS